MTARASIVIPAHNEARVVGRLLEGLQGLPSDVEVIVVCNGCTDDTEDVVRRCSGTLELRLQSIPQASKVAALNEGDRIATAFPRVYLDADVRVSATSVMAVAVDLEAGHHLGARPPLQFDVSGGDFIVRSFYRARSRVPYLMSALWGAGLYAVSGTGRSRWGTFPEGEADDYFVAAQFGVDEFGIVNTEPVLVSTPRTARALVRTLRRVYALPRRTAGASMISSAATLRSFARVGVRSPLAALDTLIYVAVALISRLPWTKPEPEAWARDETNR